MRTVVQRVSRAEVRVDGEIVGKIGRGVLALVGVQKGDTDADADATVAKLAGLRIFPERTPMDLSLEEIGGEVLVISQFTLLGRVKKGRRPSFDQAEDPTLAERLYERVADGLAARDLGVARGRFGAHMEVELINEGPVTILLFTESGKIVDL